MELQQPKIEDFKGNKAFMELFNGLNYVLYQHIEEDVKLMSDWKENINIYVMLDEVLNTVENGFMRYDYINEKIVIAYYNDEEVITFIFK